MVSGEKRNCEGENVLERIKVILLDIEGTTSSISFVKDTLFPFVRENLEKYVDTHWDDEEFIADLKALKAQAKKDEEDKVNDLCIIEEGEKEKETLIKNILWQMDIDRKTSALKQLQGHIWREGYENGKFKGHVYNDVPQMLKKWCEDGRKLYIYSSGSVEAQKLLFKNSENGDLQGFLSGYFDTEVGPKTEASSYTNIAKAVGCECCQILFLTDVVKEAVAADKAGMQVMIVVREGNVPLTDDEKKAFTIINSFKDIVFESSAKKKKICDEESIAQEDAKTENEKTEKEVEVENGEVEKMEVEPSESKVENDSQENKTEENGEQKTEPMEELPETNVDKIDVDVDELNTEKVSSSVAESEEKKEEINSNAVVEEKSTEEVNPPDSEVSTEAKVDTTSESEKATNESEKAVSEVAEEVKETEEEEKEKEEKKESTHETEEKDEKSVNGHENGEHKEEEKEVSGEVEAEANTKVDDVETMPIKKIAPEEQADSTVEVTA